MSYWFNKSISDILRMVDYAKIDYSGKVRIDGKLIRSVYISLEMLHKINLQLPYSQQQTLTEFITIANNMVNSLSAKRDSIFGPMYFEGFIKDFSIKANRLWEINNNYFIR